MTTLLTFATAQLHYPAFHAGLIGWGIAAKADWEAFRTWKSFSDLKQYHWGIALWNWTQGFVLGYVGGSALGAMLG